MKSILCARSTVALAVTLAGAALPAASARPADPVPPLPGGLTAPLPEPASHREVRKRRVAARRQGPAILVHRGAAAFAPENSLEAYAAAMEYGADGCEVDVRRTVDGVLVLFHDDMLDRLTFGFGTV
ncbi:MAG: glycerophosphodiester phosphodiesterase, partial [Armatimonadetes bacterium]|nr:glycerophosphodiester phosphodiesterase [Armatimonadota bacterium]